MKKWMLFLLTIPLLLTGCSSIEAPASPSAEDSSPAPGDYSAEPDASTQPGDFRAESEAPTQPGFGDAITQSVDGMGVGKFSNIRIADKFGKWPEQTGEPYYTSQVGMWYTLWWTGEGTKTYNFWWAWTGLKPVEFGYYSSGDRDYLATNLQYFNNIGIDYLILDDTNEHFYVLYNGAIDANMRACYEVAAALDGKSPQIAIATGGPIRRPDVGGQQAELDLYYEEFVTKYPGVHFSWQGKPLVLMYYGGSTWAFSTFIADSRFTIRTGTGKTSWGTNASVINDDYGNWGWVYDRQWPGSEVYGVQAGYMASAGTVSREDGQRYIREWLAAIEENPQTIIIPSWNDHAEYTSIEPAQWWPNFEDPFFYEKVTEGYLALRYGLIEGFYYRAKSSAEIYKYSGAELVLFNEIPSYTEPVILVPDDYFDWLGVKIVK